MATYTTAQDSDDEFPDLETLCRGASALPWQPEGKARGQAPAAVRRRRKLGETSQNPLLRRWERPDPERMVGGWGEDNAAGAAEPRGASVRKRSNTPPLFAEEPAGTASRQRRTPVASLDDDERPEVPGRVDEDSPAVATRKGAVANMATLLVAEGGRSAQNRGGVHGRATIMGDKPALPPARQRRRGAEGEQPSPERRAPAHPGSTSAPESSAAFGIPSSGSSHSAPLARPATPPKCDNPLLSPKKAPRIPMTPHRPSTDAFWDREFVDSWNDQHSPKKTLFKETATASPRKTKRDQAASQKETKRAFEKRKHELADTFLRELDQAVTGGRIGELSSSTGGVQIRWTKKLNTTAGRATWKRETVRPKQDEGGDEGREGGARHRHHAAIELAEKVIDDEHRLLNVIAHEFCHLANFMISGVTGNPHGREFKAWAAKCSLLFGDRGIAVTTKHNYDIDFRYVWECLACSTEFKRHSKSINPERHRCGSCKGELKQTRPAPRRVGKESDYQKFVREHMKSVREENPDSPQKDILKLVADKWSRSGGGRGRNVEAGSREQAGVEDAVDALTHLTIRDED